VPSAHAGGTPNIHPSTKTQNSACSTQAVPDTFYVELALRALPLWRQLEAETGTSVLTETGAVDHGPEAATRTLQDALTAAGRPRELLTPGEVAGRWPGLRADTSALSHPEAGRLHADAAVAALQKGATARGAQVRHGARVTRIATRMDTHVEVVTAAQEALLADAVVVAVGGWAPSTLHQLDMAAPVLRVTQEQPAHFPAADALTWPSFIHHGGAALSAESGTGWAASTGSRSASMRSARSSTRTTATAASTRSPANWLPTSLTGSRRGSVRPRPPTRPPGQPIAAAGRIPERRSASVPPKTRGDRAAHRNARNAAAAAYVIAMHSGR
jgi:hypothetical protein